VQYIIIREKSYTKLLHQQNIRLNSTCLCSIELFPDYIDIHRA